MRNLATLQSIISFNPLIGNSSPTENILYTFNASTASLGAVPSDLVIEDGGSDYTIANVAVVGNYISKVNTDCKALFFNTANVFLVPIKARFFFYVNSATSYCDLFTTSLQNSANTGGWMVGIENGSAGAKNEGRKINTNAGFSLSEGAGPAQDYAFTPGNKYAIEVWTDGTNKENGRVSMDGGITYMEHFICNYGSYNLKKVACILGCEKNTKCMVTKVEVIENI